MRYETQAAAEQGAIRMNAYRGPGRCKVRASYSVHGYWQVIEFSPYSQGSVAYYGAAV
jgi:hypothetical protein